MDKLMEVAIPAVIIILILVMVAFWIINCIQINNKKSSAISLIIVIATAILIIAAVLFVKIGFINRTAGDTDKNIVQPTTAADGIPVGDAANPETPDASFDPDAPIKTLEPNDGSGANGTNNITPPPNQNTDNTGINGGGTTANPVQGNARGDQHRSQVEPKNQ